MVLPVPSLTRGLPWPNRRCSPLITVVRLLQVPSRRSQEPDLRRRMANMSSVPRIVSKSSATGNSVSSPSRVTEAPSIDSTNDTRSPLVRFRSFPRKPFTVTDLTAGTWCELQYFYTLTRLPFGRKTRTAAMKQGTKVHQDLEDEVHTTVRVEIASRVDGFGLRIWNIIQGLRTLREMGMTRELEVWGFVDGNLVNGVIDGLSYKDPDPELAERLRKEPGSQNQVAITDFFPSKKPSRGKIPRVYLTDVKTRGTKKVPNSSSLLWPAKVQLSLYQRFLSEMAADKLDYLRIFRRYNLDPDEPFSDSFIAQIGTLHEELFEVESSDEEEYVPPSSGRTKNDIESDAASDHSTSNFIKYTTLREVLPLLVSELKETFPHGSDSVGRLLEVEYRYRGDGSLIANQTFTMDDHELDHYLGNTMEWWRADREPKGVQIEEAYKCRMCEFADDCTWRSAMDEERLQAVRQRLESRSKHVTASG
ncbi:defects in morphology protein 1 [Colletotrichum truncatum]|uniref:Defects in morphology protein 1 n=1 Tax=Colletotrichum truncatum TaxID=5467 RepID=A0ACC3YNB5_COLTU